MPYNTLDTGFINKSDIYIEMTSSRWRTPVKISLENLINEIQSVKQPPYDITSDIDAYTLILDPSTLKVKCNTMIFNVFSEPFNEHNIYHSKPPINAMSIPSMHLMTDNNYLYVWVNNRWKRALLSEW